MMANNFLEMLKYMNQLQGACCISSMINQKIRKEKKRKKENPYMWNYQNKDIFKKFVKNWYHTNQVIQTK